MSDTLRASEHSTRIETEGEWRLRIVSYRLGDRFICTVDNVDPGARLATAEGTSREEAEAGALKEARGKVRSTRTFD